MDLEKFSLSISKFKKPVIIKNIPNSQASSSAPKRMLLLFMAYTIMAKVIHDLIAPRAAKKRRTSAANSEEDDFIAPSDEDEDDDDPPPARSRTASTSSRSGSGMDVDSDEDEERPAKKSSKAAPKVLDLPA